MQSLFRDVPEIAFIGCHSAKYEGESGLEAVKSAMLKYRVNHPVFIDFDMAFWKE